ncbi:hypothetical protein MRX96_014378 [Rhipicephalus microplus]
MSFGRPHTPTEQTKCDVPKTRRDQRDYTTAFAYRKRPPERPGKALVRKALLEQPRLSIRALRPQRGGSGASRQGSLSRRRRPHRERLEVNVRWLARVPQSGPRLRVTQGRRDSA